MYFAKMCFVVQIVQQINEDYYDDGRSIIESNGAELTRGIDTKQRPCSSERQSRLTKINRELAPKSRSKNLFC